jgi:hypothetical protein
VRFANLCKCQSSTSHQLEHCRDWTPRSTGCVPGPDARLNHKNEEIWLHGGKAVAGRSRNVPGNGLNADMSSDDDDALSLDPSSGPATRAPSPGAHAPERGAKEARLGSFGHDSDHDMRVTRLTELLPWARRVFQIWGRRCGGPRSSCAAD